jgi:hypothetical protein
MTDQREAAAKVCEDMANTTASGQVAAALLTAASTIRALPAGGEPVAIPKGHCSLFVHYSSKCAQEARCLGASPPPQDAVLVPREPTAEMVKAGILAFPASAQGWYGRHGYAEKIYRAMLAMTDVTKEGE